MKMKTLLLAGTVILSAGLRAQDFELISGDPASLIFEHHFTQKTFAITPINGSDFVSFGKSFPVTTKDAGAPELPMFSESVIIPGKGDVSLEILFDGFYEIPNVQVAPSKGSLKRNVDPQNVPYTFGDVYQQDAFYPAAPARLNDPFVIRNTRGVTVTCYPYQYNPHTKTLRVYQNLRVKVVTGSQKGLNEVSERSETSEIFRTIYANHFLNGSNPDQAKYTPHTEAGQMLVITSPNFTANIEDLVDWKTRKGIKTTVVTTTETGMSDSQIKSYVSDFYSSNPDLVFVLLVGDHADVPSHSYGNSGGEELWSDSYYGQLSGGANDYYPEAFVGRISGNSSQISSQVAKILEYETNPAPGDWMTNAIGLGSGEGSGYGDDGEADWQHLRNIRTQLVGFGYNEVYEFYDGSRGGEDASGDPNSAIILPAVNAGVGLFNYTGHGAQNLCVTGNFSSSHINSAINNGKYPFVISVACNNGTFTSGTCISEVWMNATNAGTPSGSIAACGSSILMAWAEPMQTQDELAAIIAEAYVNNHKATLGGIFYNAQMSMLEQYNNGSAREVMQTWVMFGDPSVEFRNKMTQNLTANHVGWMPQTETAVDVNCNTEGADVALVQDGEILGTAQVSGGVAHFTGLSLATNSPVYVTASKQNYKPYQGYIIIGNGTASLDEQAVKDLQVFPNPAKDFVRIRFENRSGSARVTLNDAQGKVLKSVTASGNGQTTMQLDLDNVGQGIYFLNVTDGAYHSVEKLVIR